MVSVLHSADWQLGNARRAANVTTLTEPNPAGDGRRHLAATSTATHRHNLYDPTADLIRRQRREHGLIRDFGSRGEANNQVPPDPAERSDLEYFALGD
jgi:hypothetical protein